MNRSLQIVNITGALSALCGAILPIFIGAFDAFPQMVAAFVIIALLCFYYTRQSKPNISVLYARYSVLAVLLIQGYIYLLLHRAYHGEIAFYLPLVIFAGIPVSKGD